MSDFWGSTYGKAILLTFGLDAIASLVLVFLGWGSWLVGVWISAIWFGVNIWLLWRMSTWVKAGQSPNQKKILIWSIIKFPLLYVVGLLLLLLPVVRIEGVLVTFTLFMAAFIVSMCWLNKGKIIQ